LRCRRVASLRVDDAGPAAAKRSTLQFVVAGRDAAIFAAQTLRRGQFGECANGWCDA
jgi:hypothetical protein